MLSTRLAFLTLWCLLIRYIQIIFEVSLYVRLLMPTSLHFYFSSLSADKLKLEWAENIVIKHASPRVYIATTCCKGLRAAINTDDTPLPAPLPPLHATPHDTSLAHAIAIYHFDALASLILATAAIYKAFRIFDGLSIWLRSVYRGDAWLLRMTSHRR